MKRWTVALAVLFLAAFAAAYQPKEKKMLRHVVLFKFKDDATASSIRQVENAFRELPSKIREIKAFEWGTNVSPEGVSQGFTHCFFASFSSEKDRDIYLPHPDHKKFTEIAGPVLDKVCVVDYWTND